MKKIIFTLIIANIWILNFAQTTWKYEYYKTINHTNYTKQALFMQDFDFKNPDIPMLNALLFFMTNDERTKRNIPSIKYNSSLEIMAYEHSKRMAENNFFSHTDNTSENRSETSERAQLAGIKNPFIAENIAYSTISNSANYFQAAKILINNWMKSPGHRKNILSKSALQGGCGVFLKNNILYGTQDFQWFEEINSTNAKDKLPGEKK